MREKLVHRLGKDEPVLPYKEGNEHHLAHEPDNLEHIRHVNLESQVNVIFNDVFFCSLVVQRLLLSDLNKRVDDRHEHPIPQIKVELTNSNSFEDPEEFEPRVDY